MRETWSTSSALTAPISCGARAKASRNTRCTRTISLVSGRVRAVADICGVLSGRGVRLHIYRGAVAPRSGKPFCPGTRCDGPREEWTEARRSAWHRIEETPDATYDVPPADRARGGIPGRRRDVPRLG